MLRRTMLWLGGLTMAGPVLAGSARAGNTVPHSFADVKPRHVLCFLGREGQLATLAEAARSAIATIATDFEVDEQYSQDEPDERMVASFAVCRDRVYPNAWSDADEQAVEDHGSVLYVLGPPMSAADSVDMSAAALRLTVHMLENGAVAAKGESAGVAHGIARWQALARDAAAAGQHNRRAGACRLTFARRPLESEEFLTSVGFHLVGLPEVYVAKKLGSDLELASVIDRVADEMRETGIEAVLKNYDARLEPVDGYEEDEFKFNPYGALRITAL